MKNGPEFVIITNSCLLNTYENCQILKHPCSPHYPIGPAIVFFWQIFLIIFKKSIKFSNDVEFCQKSFKFTYGYFRIFYRPRFDNYFQERCKKRHSVPVVKQAVPSISKSTVGQSSEVIKGWKMYSFPPTPTRCESYAIYIQPGPLLFTDTTNWFSSSGTISQIIR